MTNFITRIEVISEASLLSCCDIGTISDSCMQVEPQFTWPLSSSTGATWMKKWMFMLLAASWMSASPAGGHGLMLPTSFRHDSWQTCYIYGTLTNQLYSTAILLWTLPLLCLLLPSFLALTTSTEYLILLNCWSVVKALEGAHNCLMFVLAW